MGYRFSDEPSLLQKFRRLLGDHLPNITRSLPNIPIEPQKVPTQHILERSLLYKQDQWRQRLEVKHSLTMISLFCLPTSLRSTFVKLNEQSQRNRSQSGQTCLFLTTGLQTFIVAMRNSSCAGLVDALVQ